MAQRRRNDEETRKKEQKESRRKKQALRTWTWRREALEWGKRRHSGDMQDN